MSKRVLYTAAALFVGCAAYVTSAANCGAAEIIHVGQAFRTGALNDGFPEFLKVAEAASTTRAWNLGGTATTPAASDQTLNGIALDGPDGGGFDHGLTVFGSPTKFGRSSLDWSTDPQVSTKNNISNTGLFTSSPASWSVDITAVAGSRYIVEILSNPVTGAVRSLDVTVDGELFADNLFVPISSGGFFSVVYKFPMIADADGIDIVFGPGGEAGTDINPYVTAIAVTLAVPEPSSVTLAFGALSLLGICGLKGVRSR